VSAANRSDFTVFLATFEHMRHGGCDDYSGAAIQEEFDSSSELQKMVDLEGNEVAKNVEVNDDHFVEHLDFVDEEADKEDFEGHTGNAGASKTLWYRRTVSSTHKKPLKLIMLTNPIGPGSHAEFEMDILHYQSSYRRICIWCDHSDTAARLIQERH
jgi:hypothetical protein